MSRIIRSQVSALRDLPQIRNSSKISPYCCYLVPITRLHYPNRISGFRSPYLDTSSGATLGIHLLHIISIRKLELSDELSTPFAP